MKTTAAIYTTRHPEIASDITSNTQAESLLIINAEGEITNFSCEKHLISPQITVKNGLHYSVALSNFKLSILNETSLADDIEFVLNGDKSSHVGFYRCLGSVLTYKIKVNALQSGALISYSDASLTNTENTQSKVYLDRIEALNSHLNNMDKGMRMRLSRDLHDATSSNLSSILMVLDVLKSLPATSQASYLSDHLSDLHGLTRDTIKSLGEVCADLRAHGSENQSLQQFIETESKKFAARTGIPVHLNIAAQNFDAAIAIKLTVQRIFIELMTNSARHANASAIQVAMHIDDCRLRLCVSDNGCGFDTNAATSRHGIKGMRELAAQSGGTFTISSSPQGGTNAVLEFTGKFESSHA